MGLCGDHVRGDNVPCHLSSSTLSLERARDWQHRDRNQNKVSSNKSRSQRTGQEQLLLLTVIYWDTNVHCIIFRFGFAAVETSGAVSTGWEIKRKLREISKQQPDLK